MHSDQPARSGSNLVYYRIVLFAPLSLFLVTALSTWLLLRHAVFILLAVLRAYFIISSLCLLPLCNAGLGSCLLQLHPPSLISLVSQCLLCCFRLPLFSPSFPCLGSVFPPFCALFFLSLTSFDSFQSPFDFVGSRTIFETLERASPRT